MNKLQNAANPLQTRFEGMAAICTEAAKSTDRRLHVDTVKVLAIQMKEIVRAMFFGIGWQ